MSTLQELYGQIIASDELKKAFVEALGAGELGDFLKQNDCAADEEEVKEYIEAKAAEDTPIELSDDELMAIAAGSFVDSVECSHKGNSCNCSNACIRDCC